MCDGDLKIFYCQTNLSELFDLVLDPDEMQNETEKPVYADKMPHFNGLLNIGWDMERFDADLRKSQAQRHIVHAPLRQG